MTSKIFRSVSNPAASFSITPSADGVRTVHMHGIEATGVTVSTADAPALMQAIGECLPPIPEKVRDGSYEAYMSVVMTYLGRAVRALEAETAEAEAQAKLEAEALELYKAHTGYTQAKFLSEAAAPDRWLAVARRAREMRAEK